MSKLLRADFSRLWKDKIFGVCFIILLGYAMFIMGLGYHDMKVYQFEMSPDGLVFSPVMLLGIVISVFVSLFVGIEYSDGTIRNKIVVGQKRGNIYLANFISCVVAGIFLYAAVLLISGGVGLLLMGPFELKISSIMLLFVDGVILTVAYTAIFNLIAMLVSNKAYAAVICVLAAFILLFAGIYIIQCLNQPEMSEQASLVDGELVYETVKNSAYLTGMKRQIYQFFADFLPGSQSVQISQCEPMHPYLMPVYSAVITVIVDILGIWGFRKKDIR